MPRTNRQPSDKTRRGGAYILVLIVSAIAVTFALSGLYLRNGTAVHAGVVDHLASARLLAQSGLENCLQWGAENDGWRAAGGKSRTFDYTVGDGKVSVLVEDPTDADLTDDDADPYALTSTATLGGARAILTANVIKTFGTEYRDRVLAYSPVGFWPLDEASGTVRANRLAGPQDGGYSMNTVPGAFTGPDARDAPLMSTATTLAYIPHYSSLAIDTGAILVSFYTNAKTGIQQTIFAKDVSAYGAGHMRLYLDSGLVLKLHYEYWTKTAEFTGATVTADEWHHAAISFGSNGLKIILDGKRVNLQKTVTCGLGIAAGGLGNSETIQLGSWYNGSGFVDPLSGSIRDFAVLDTQLTEADVQTLLTDTQDGPWKIEAGSWAWVTE